MPDPVADPQAPTQPGTSASTPAPDPTATAAPTEPVASAPVVPEKYEFKLGEGLELDPKSVELFTPVLKKLGVTQEAASELAQVFHAELQRQDQMLSELYVAQAKSWETQAKSDSEFGGAAFDTNLTLAQKAVGRFASDGLKQILNETGLGNHPEVIRLFWKLGQTISEDISIQGGNTGTQRKSIESLLFDHPTSQQMQ